MLPPGRARLATRPLPTGLPTPTITMGTVVVASLVARAAGSPCVTMTIRLALDQLGREGREPLIVPCRRAVLQDKELELFSTQSRDAGGQLRGIPARTGAAGHESTPHRVAGQREHDRHHRGERLRRLRSHRPPDDEDINLQAEEFDRECGDPVEHPVRIPLLDDDALTLGVAKLTPPLPERCEEGIRKRTFPEHSDPRNLRGLLRMGGERPHEQAQDERHDAPNGAVPHGRLLKSASCYSSSFR
jgi:hypothetical protein